MTDLGDLFRETRKRKKLSQRQVAIKAGVKENTLRYIENGYRYPYKQTADVIAKALGVRIVVTLVDESEVLNGKP